MHDDMGNDNLDLAHELAEQRSIVEVLNKFSKLASMLRKQVNLYA